MLEITPQERMALGVTALLLAAGAGARVLADAELLGGEQVAALSGDSSATLPREEVEAQLAEKKVSSRPLADGERIDVNTASVAELQRLPRVGPALAARIVAHREENGPFRTIADLDAVSGVGPAMLEGLIPHLSLPPALAAPDRPGGSVPAGTGRSIGMSGSVSASRSVAPASAERVYVNRADAVELQTLPGIGPALAGRIIAWRNENGRFRSGEDLEKVSGIGPKVREQLEPRVRFDP